ncbi:hypothetical protein Tco_0609365 [Tanacetum coccineum]
MAFIRASISKVSKRPKINIIPPKQLFVDLTHDDTKTPSPKHQLSSPSTPNVPSKTPSTKGTSSSSIDYTPKSPTSPSTNGYLNSLTSSPQEFLHHLQLKKMHQLPHLMSNLILHHLLHLSLVILFLGTFLRHMETHCLGCEEKRSCEVKISCEAKRSREVKQSFHAYYSISPTRYYKDDSCWSTDLKSKTTEDIINIRSFVEVLVLNHYAVVRKILIILGHTGIVQAAKLCKQADIQEGGEESVISTKEYIREVVEDVGEDEDFKHGLWVTFPRNGSGVGGSGVRGSGVGGSGVVGIGVGGSGLLDGEEIIKLLEEEEMVKE